MKLSVLALLLAAALPGWSETLALTVQYHNGEPNEEWDRWTTQYFVDDQGRLARVVRDIVESRSGAAREERVFRWDAAGVRWSLGSTGSKVEYSIEFQSDGLQFQWAYSRSDGTTPGGTKNFRWTDGGGENWESDQYRYHWAKSTGLSRKLASPDKTGRAREITTSGARVTFWRGSTESDIFLVSTEPKAIVVQYFGDLMPPPVGWSPAGQARATGTGLWSEDPQVRLATVSIVEDDPEYLLLVPLILERNYLR